MKSYLKFRLFVTFLVVACVVGVGAFLFSILGAYRGATSVYFARYSQAREYEVQRGDFRGLGQRSLLSVGFREYNKGRSCVFRAFRVYRVTLSRYRGRASPLCSQGVFYR